MPIYFYVFPEHAGGAAVTDVKVKNMIAAFATRFGPYPFQSEKYGEAEFTWGGGMEHQLPGAAEKKGNDRVHHPVLPGLGRLPRVCGDDAKLGLEAEPAAERAVHEDGVIVLGARE